MKQAAKPQKAAAPRPAAPARPVMGAAAMAEQAATPREQMLTLALAEARKTLDQYRVTHPLTREWIREAIQDGYRQGYQAGYDVGFRKAGMEVLRTVYAGVCLGLHEAFGFGETRIPRAVEAIQRNTILALHSSELVEQVYQVTGMRIDFDDPVEPLWKGAPGKGKWPSPDEIAARIMAETAEKEKQQEATE